MSRYRRVRIPGGTYFFTVVTARRRPWLGTAAGRAALAAALRAVRADQPFETDAIVLLPDHLHCVWTLPPGDTDYARRWRRIKQRTTIILRESPNGPLWQRRYWEHLIRDEADLHRHLDYIHYNPVRHGLAKAPRDWGPTSFHRFVERGWYSVHWAGPETEIEVPE